MICIEVLFFFFFFKQKTAYEMRISDWSSDVCSSDLLHPVIEFGVAHLTQQLLRVSGANEPLVDQRDAVGMECDASDRGDRPVKMGLDPPEQGTFPDIGLVTPARDRQIGRASCRERVCQYV